MVATNRQSQALKAVQKNAIKDDLEESKRVPKALSKTAQKRVDLAKFLGRTGRGINCRIDLQILSVEDIKKAAFELDKLSKNLTKIAEFEGENDVLQVLSARHEFSKTKVQIKTFVSDNKEK